MERRGSQGAGAGPVAVVGASCRLPGAPDLAAFARLLEAGGDAVTHLPADRFTLDRFLHPRPGERGRAAHFQAGTVGDLLSFDAAAFGLSPREAEEMDPQQRLVLELTRRALEDAGWAEDAVAGHPLGVFAAASATDWSTLRAFDMAAADRYVMTGSALSIVANRLSHAFDWRGPALTVDTACSSGLVALHQAVQALRSGQAPAAVVAAVNVLLSPFPFGGFWRAGMLGRRGRCQAFGAGADGYVRAEGGVVLVLKPLAAALRDGDAVRAVILATGVNAAGRTNGISLPDGAAQAALIRQVREEAGLAGDAIGYFEAHGTGTPVGDPIEAQAISQGVGPRRQPLPIGSAKSNIGHTEAAAGLVGLLKAMLVLQSGRIPPTLHCQPPNPAIPFAALGLRPAATAQPLAGAAAMVNSFGFGGTNGCAALAAAPAAPRARPAAGAPPLLLSAHSAPALRALAESWRGRRATPALARAQARHRALRPHRLVLRGPGALEAWLAGEDAPGATAGLAPAGQGVAFAFPGNGAQWAGMGRDAMRAWPAFRTAVRAADAHLRPHLGWSVARALSRGATAEEVADTTRAQPLLYAFQLGLVAALAEHGIRPALVLGHSVGEVAAAEVAGLLPPAAAARLVAARSRHQGRTRGQGRMAALGAAATEAAPVLEALGLELAAVNGPAALTVAGAPAALERLEAEARARRWSFVALDLDYAFHSSVMEPVRAGLLEDLRGLRGGRPRLPMLSSVTGEALERAPAAYWWRNLREPVRFDLAAAAALARRPALVLEIGPHAVLQGYLRANARAAGWDGAILPALRKDGPADLAALADRCTALGADPRGAPCFAGPADWRALPPSPLLRERLAPTASPERRGVVAPARDGILLGFRQDEEAGEEWRRTLDTLEEPWLADHALEHGALLPAAAIAEMALEAAARRHPAAPLLELRGLAIHQPLPLGAEAAREVRCRLDDAGLWTLDSRRRLSAEAWVRHAEARIGPGPALPDAPAGTPDAPWRDGAALTAAAARRGLRYGPAFRPVRRWRAAGAAVEAELERPAAAPPDDAFLLHPARLDGALQALLGLAGEEEAGFLPVRIERLVLRRGAAAPVRATLRLRPGGTRDLAADGALRDALGAAVATLEGVTLRRTPRRDALDGRLFHATLRPAPLPPAWPEPAPALTPTLAPAAEAAAPPSDAALLVAAHQAAALREAGLSAAAGPLAARLRALAPAEDLPPARDIWQQVAAEAPALAPELALLAEAAALLPEALAGRPAAPRLSPAAPTLHRLAEALAAEAAALLRPWPPARPCRVVVAGAEDGPLLPALRRALAFLGPALELAPAVLPGARPPAMAEDAAPLYWPAGEDLPGDAALVVGLNLSARLGAGAALAARLRPGVAPGGALLLAEPLPDLFWEATEGLAWEDSRLLDAGGWQAALREAGFAQPAARPAETGLWPAILLRAAVPPGAAVLAAAPGRRFALWGPGGPG
ncbi:type I polyketide synthase, partial [Roseococcus sp. DSY-14]|uniref:type I polyketide synthase n=1 Tax=Roseococcus sp. DSY-14 TaxID=3369650 RepID=UPI00387ABAE6